MWRVRFLRNAIFSLLGRCFASWQVPGIERLGAVQVHVDDAPAHQFHQRLVGITPFQNGDLWVGARHHEQEQLRHEGLAAAALRHDEHVRVAEACVERRERNELPVGCFKKHERRILGPSPGHLHRQ